jgi:hypothetical protein
MLTLATKFRPDEPQAFDTACQAGIVGAEFWLDNSLLLRWSSIVSTARKYPFRYILHFPNAGTLDTVALKCVSSLYTALDCRAMVIHPPMYRQYAETLLTIDPAIRLAVENHTLDVAEFNRWAADNRWLTLDVEHLWMATLRNAPLKDLLDHLDRFLVQHSQKLCHVHLPGYQIGGREHCPIHYGAEMATRALGLLSAHGYTGLVTSEADTEYQTLYELQQDAAMFETWRRARLAG